MSRRFLRIVAMLAALAPAPAAAQAPNPGKYSPAQFEVRAERGLKVAMRDRVNLALSVHRPAAEGHTPRSWSAPPTTRTARA